MRLSMPPHHALDRVALVAGGTPIPSRLRARRCRSGSWPNGRRCGLVARGVPGRLPTTRGRRPHGHGGKGRIRAARFPARKSLEEFDYDHARSPKRRDHRPPGHPYNFVLAKKNVVFPGPPDTGKT
jgi:IstB-like ATP binding protein